MGLVCPLGTVCIHIEKEDCLKVLFFSHQADFLYGGEICTLAFMAELKKRGVEVHFASPPGPYLERAKEFAHCHAVSSRQFSRKISHLPFFIPAYFQTQKELATILQKHSIDLVHATSLKAMVYVWPLGKRFSVLWHHHDILPMGWKNSLWLRALAWRAKRILVPSRATQAALLDAGVKKSFVLHNGFELNTWRVRDSRQSVTPFRVALIGEISVRKGTDRLPEILHLLREMGQLDGIEFLIIGDALSQKAFADGIRESLKGEVVSFLGRREDVSKLLQAIDLLLVPSRQDPLPTVIVEAALSGVPAIGSRVGGIPEMIVDGKNGFLADAAEEYAEKILAARDLQTWAKLSQGARKTAEEKFSVAPLTDELLEHYRSIRG